MAWFLLKALLWFGWRLLFSIGFNVCILVAVVILYAWYSAIADATDTTKKVFASGHNAHARVIATQLPNLPHTEESAWKSYLESRSEEATPYLPPIFIHAERLQRLCDSLLEKVSRDFVRSWYPLISTESVFLSRVDAFLYTVAMNLKHRAERVDVVLFCASKVLPLWTAHVTECHKAERLLRGERVRRATADQDKADCQLAKYYLNGALHPAITAQPKATLPLEQAYLRSVADSMLPLLCTTSDIDSRVFSSIVREILVCKLLQPIAESLSDPDFWNRTIAMLSESMIQQEENLMTKIRETLERQNALDQMESGMRNAMMSLRSYDEFLKLIKTCDNLLDGGRIRDALALEIQKKRTEIANCQASDIINGVRVSDTRVYINRLLLAHRRMEKRLAFLNDRTKAAEPGEPERAPSLGAILDTPELLGAFTEFMDEINRIHILHFWMSVNSLRNILSPDAFDDMDVDIDYEKVVNTPADLELLNDSALRIYRDYLSPQSPRKVDISGSLRQQLGTFAGKTSLEGDLASSEMVGAIFAAQHEVFRQMEEGDYMNFLNSSCFSEVNMSSSPGMLGSYHLEDNIENSAKKSGDEQMRSRSPNDMLSHPASENLDDAGRMKTKKSILLKVFRKKKIRDDSSITSTEHEEEAAEVPVRRDAGVNVERELEAILNSEERAFGSPTMEHKPRDMKRQLSLKARRSQSVDMSSMRVAEHGERPLGEEVASSSESEPSSSPSKGSFERVTSKPETEPIRKSSFEKVPVSGRKTSMAKSASSAVLLSIGGKDRDRVTASTQLTLSALDPSRPFKGRMVRSMSSRQVSTRSTIKAPSPSTSDSLKVEPPPPLKVKHRLLRRGSVSQPVLPDKDPDEDKISLHSSSSFSMSSQEDLSALLNSKSISEPSSPVSPTGGGPLIVMPRRVSELEREVFRLRTEAEDMEKELQKTHEVGGDLEQRRKLQLMRTGLKVELEATEKEKMKLEGMEMENLIIPGRTYINIACGEYVPEGGAKDYAVYHLEVHIVNSEGDSSEWTVARRFSEFFALHQLLRGRFPHMSQVEFPSKIFTGVFKLKKDIVNDRRVALEKYLQTLLKHEDVCKSAELRQFICHPDVLALLNLDNQRPGQSSQRSIMKNPKYNVDGPFEAFLGRVRNPSATPPQIPTRPKNIANSSLVAASMISSSSSTLSSGAASTIMKAELQAASVVDAAAKGGVPAPSTGLATDAIVELFIELFELREKNNWLRRRAVALILQQLFGGTVEKRIAENLRWAVGEENIAYGLEWILNSYWPDGQWATNWVGRTPEEIRRTKAEAQEKLTELLPEILGNMVGKGNAKRGAVRLWSGFQNRRLNQQLVYCLLDQIFLQMFPELEGRGVVHNVKYSSAL